jgi:hypothetical protein
MRTGLTWGNLCSASLITSVGALSQVRKVTTLNFHHGQDRGAITDAAAVFAQSADHVLAGNAEHILLGPIVLDDSDLPYFVVGSATASGEFRVDQFKASERDLAEMWRANLFLALVTRRPIVIHDFDDELEMARWAAAICPSARTARILAAIRRERGVA